MVKVDNAIILAAGRGSRLKDLTSHTPKPLLKPRGKVIIEEIIKNLQLAEIKKIYVVVGYLGEKFEYLKSKFNVKIILNSEWNKGNNITSIMAALPHLKNSLVVNGDIIMKKNVFVNHFNCAISYAEQNKNQAEWIIELNKNGNITYFDKNGIDKEGLYQKEILFITKEISSYIKEYSTSIDKDEYYEILILKITKKLEIDFKTKLIDTGVVFDLDTKESFVNYEREK